MGARSAEGFVLHAPKAEFAVCAGERIAFLFDIVLSLLPEAAPALADGNSRNKQDHQTE
jgi:hypothetical protein